MRCICRWQPFSRVRYVRPSGSKTKIPILTNKLLPKATGASTAPFLQTTLYIEESDTLMSKYKHLPHIYPKDLRAISVIARSGGIDKETLNKLQISNNRIRNYCKEGLLKEVTIPELHGSGHQNFYELTSKGNDFAKSECDIKHFISNNNASVHNSAVSKFMVDHLSRAELESVRSERELSVFLESRLNEYYNNERDQYEELLQTMQEHKLSMPDFIYTTSAGETIAVEIVTSSYSQEDIDLKIETASLLKIQIEIVQA